MGRPQDWLEITLLSIEGFTAVLLLIFLFIYWSKCDKSPLRHVFTFFQVLVIFYVSSHIFVHVNAVIGIQSIIFRFIKDLSFLYTQFVFLHLCLIYTNPLKPINKQFLYMYLFPIAYTILLLTNPWHGIMGKLYSPPCFNGFHDCDFNKSTICTVIDYSVLILLIIPSIGLIILKLSKQKGRILKQSILLSIIGSIPILLYGYDMFIHKIIPTDFDPAPVAIAATTLFFNFAVIHFRLFDLLPVAFNDIVENIKAAVVILNEENKIIYSNLFFNLVFSDILNLKYYEKMDTLLDKLNTYSKREDIEVFKKIINSTMKSPQTFELNINLLDKTTFVVNIQPISPHGNKNLGKIISFNDVTAYKNLLNELTISNKKLKEYSSAVEDLAVTNERNRIARDIHDSISYELTSIINMLDICMLDFKNGDKEKAVESLTLSSLSSRKCLTELRNSIFCLTQTGFESCEKSLKLIESLVSNFRRLGVNIDFTVIGDFYIDNSQTWEAIFRICQESMTNAMRHGRAENITIIIKLNEENKIKLYIIDDGKGCININKGIGLTSMEQRVKSIDGTIVYGSGDGGGFYINVMIPYAS